MPKKKEEGKKFELVRLPYRFKFQKSSANPVPNGWRSSKHCVMKSLEIILRKRTN
jgi:hypothetical protein